MPAAIHCRPIPMSAPMVPVTIDGTKTQTRRLVSKNHLPWFDNSVANFLEGKWDQRPLPYGKRGDRLYVKEAWRAPKSLDDLSPSQIAQKCIDAGYRQPWCPIQYEADLEKVNGWAGWSTNPIEAEPGRYRHARFMPRWASRITLEITGIRVERLQDISEADAAAEGWVKQPERSPDPEVHRDAARDWYQDLWNQLNGDGSWGLNPLVWVIEFKRVEIARAAA